MWEPRLLSARNDRGAAPVEAVFGIVMLLALVLGVIEVAFALYARNVVASAAHEAARTAVEVGRSPEEAAVVAKRTVERSAGGLMADVQVLTQVEQGSSPAIRVLVRGTFKPFGPVPVPLRFETTATSSLPESDP